MYQRNKRITSYFILFSLLIIIGVAFAILQANLQINGTAKITQNTWDVHFENIVVNPNSVSIGTGDSAATIDPNNNCKVDFSVTLSLPGDFYEFTVDVKNAGTIDGMIGTLTKSLKINNVETETIPEYLNYTVTYEDGIEIVENHLLAKNTFETYKIRIEFKTDIDAEDLPDDTTLSMSVEPIYVQADENAVEVCSPSNFSTDSWETVVCAAKRGLFDTYNLGDTKTIDMGSFGTHTVRITNTTTPAECSTEGFSQTACGIVLEFADIITRHDMNPTGEYNGTNYQYGWNVDGWPASSMRTYVNNDIYNALPVVIKNAIIDTTVVSGHGKTTGETNFTSTDKLYLLSTHEVWEDVDGNIGSGIDSYDTAYHNTRQLDYYKGLNVKISNNVNTSNYSSAIKIINGGFNSFWWLRSAYSYSALTFNIVSTDGNWGDSGAYNTFGISPAFRIG